MHQTLISYEMYKWIHLLSVVLFIGLSSVLLWYGGKVKIFSIISGIASLLILVSGLGLMTNLGIAHAGPWPMWIKLKLSIWLALVILVPVIQKRIPKLGKIVFWLMYIAFALASYAVIFKML